MTETPTLEDKFSAALESDGFGAEFELLIDMHATLNAISDVMLDKYPLIKDTVNKLGKRYEVIFAETLKRVKGEV